MRRKTRMNPWKVCLVLLACATLASAQDPDKKENGNGKLVQIKFAKGTKLTEILDHIRKSTSRPVLYDTSDNRIRNKELNVEFVHRVPQDKLYPVFRAILAFFELTLVPIGPRGYEIYLVIDSRSTNNFIKNKAEYVAYEDLEKYADHDGHYISCAIPIRNIENLTTLRTALSTMAATSRHSSSSTDFTDTFASLSQPDCPRRSARMDTGAP